MVKDKGYSTINKLMEHLRDSGIKINGNYQKRQLINYGYYHGYKGYRFFNNPCNKIPFSDHKQIISVIKYDSNLKALFYPNLMFIETALKSITVNIILQEADSNEINVIFNKLMPGYIEAPMGVTPENKKKMQNKKLSLQNKIRASLLKAYEKDNKIVTHFYNSIKYKDVPIWAVFEILTLGDFGMFVSCLNQSTRRKISDYLKLDLSGDTANTLIYNIIYVVKDLRNAVAHNDIVFDTRFKNININKPLKICLTHDVGVPFVNFDAVVDYVILIAYILKKFEVSAKEILNMINTFEKCTEELKKQIPDDIYSMIVHSDTCKKIKDIKKFIEN